MELPLFSLGSGRVGSVRIAASMYEVTPRVDIMDRVVQWQRAKKRQGTHKAKGMAEVSGTTKKPYKQKGTGNARQGSLRSPQFRSGGVVHGPVCRDHGYKLPKKVRHLGLLSAVAVKFRAGKVVLLDEARPLVCKTKALSRSMDSMGLCSALVVDRSIADNLRLSVRMLENVDALPVCGLNVFDILKHEHLVLTLDGLRDLSERLGREIFASQDSVASIHMSPQRRSGPQPAENASAPAGRAYRLQPDRSELPLHYRLLHGLARGNVEQRRSALVTLRSTLPTGLQASDYVDRIIPLITASGDAGVEAALTLCSLVRPDRYANVDRREQMVRLHEDLPDILRDEGLEFVSSIDTIDRSENRSSDRRRIEIVARVRTELSLGPGQEPIRLRLLPGLPPGGQVQCRVSGIGVEAAGFREVSPPAPGPGDVGAVALEGTVNVGKDARIHVDLFLGDQWLERRELQIGRPVASSGARP